jgi:predicted transcriptional regulator
MSIELLQEIGLNKYEAEAYYTLLTQGPLTGYELGKRSRVPLSRSYDVLERLSQRGLALAQPGDPARYKALEPELFLGQVRANLDHTLTELANILTETKPPGAASEFWVIRGRAHILARAKALCERARETLHVSLPEAYFGEISDKLAEARWRGCSISLTTDTAPGSTTIALLVDRREALLGTLEPGESCQAAFSANPALLATLSSAFTPARWASGATPEEQSASPSTEEHSDWLAWEERKQQRLRKNKPNQHIA